MLQRLRKAKSRSNLSSNTLGLANGDGAEHTLAPGLPVAGLGFCCLPELFCCLLGAAALGLDFTCVATVTVDGSGHTEDTRRQAEYVSQLVSKQTLLTGKDTAMLGMQS